MNLSTILADCYRRLNFTATPPATVATRLTRFVNEAWEELVSEPGLSECLVRHDPPITLASVASQAVYALTTTERIAAVVDRVNQRRLTMRTRDWYRAVLPNPAIITGLPETWVPLGFSPVATQPAAATGLWVVSSSAADTTQKAYLETLRTGGLAHVAAAVTLNGVTRVQVGLLTDHVEVTKCYVDTVGAGDISLYDAAANGTLLATIPIGKTYSRYQSVAFYPTPAGVVTYTIDLDRDVSDLVNATDEPEMVARFHRVLVDGVLWREMEVMDDDRANQVKLRAQRGVSRLKYYATCPPDYLPKRGDRGAERSRLGGWFPPTRY